MYVCFDIIINNMSLKFVINKFILVILCEFETIIIGSERVNICVFE